MLYKTHIVMHFTCKYEREYERVCSYIVILTQNTNSFGYGIDHLLYDNDIHYPNPIFFHCNNLFIYNKELSTINNYFLFYIPAALTENNNFMTNTSISCEYNYRYSVFRHLVPVWITAYDLLATVMPFYFYFYLTFFINSLHLKLEEKTPRL